MNKKLVTQRKPFLVMTMNESRYSKNEPYRKFVYQNIEKYHFLHNWTVFDYTMQQIIKRIIAITLLILLMYFTPSYAQRFYLSMEKVPER